MPKEYLNEWYEEQFLRKTFEPGNDDLVFASTPATEKATGLTYLKIVTRLEQHRVNNTATESIVITGLEPEKQLQVTLPQIIFRR